jgi:hypothetical protein
MSSDAHATAQQKLQSCEQLLRTSGKNHVTITDQDGTQRHMRLEVVEHEHGTAERRLPIMGARL